MRVVGLERTPIRTRTGGGAAGAVAGQLSQALASFALQVVAARSLGAAGLGTFALLYSVVLMTAAAGNGLVGDSLTVLPRGADDVRSALQRWGVLLPVASGVVAAAVLWCSGVVSGAAVPLFGLAAAAFLLESSLRRLLMATMRFWSLVVVDGLGLVTSLLVLLGWAVAGSVTLDALLSAWVVGQAVACAAAVARLPAAERRLAPWRPAAVRRVAAFGLWRAAQQSVRPTMLTTARVLVVLAAGSAAFGQLEAARIYMAPALLVVQGLGSYLFSTYAAEADVPLVRLVHRADRAATLLCVTTLAMGALGLVVSPWLGRVVTGQSFSLVPVAVFGWGVYAASSAAVMPFASLAAVRGRQRTVMGLRTADSALSLALLVVLLFPGGLDAAWTPYALAAGSFLGGALVRRLVLRPLSECADAVGVRC